METYIALLRGINVGGRNKIPMTDLRQALESAGLKNVQTYIQSGNIILQSDNTKDRVELLIHQVIFDTFGFEIFVLIKTQNQWDSLVRGNPFLNKSGEENYLKYLNLTLLKSPLPDSLLEKTKTIKSSEEDIFISNTHVYLWYGGGQARSKLAETISKYPDGTTRNWNTVLKLKDIASACVSQKIQ